MLIGRTVGHARFGDGVIVRIEGRQMTVRFESGERRFVYPDALSEYLAVRDPDAEGEVSLLLSASRRAREALESQRRLERQYLSDRGTVISGRRREAELAEDDPESDL